MANNKYKILVVEDENNIRNLISRILESNNYQVIEAPTYCAAISLYASYHPDLILLDLGLPDKDGMCVIEKIREESIVPIIVLSARSDEKDKVDALDAGANDYVMKPFGSAELLARVRSSLRNSRYSSEKSRLPNSCFKYRDLVIDYDARRVFIAKKEIKLTQNEYNIVAFLSEHSGKVVTYHSIIKKIWGYSDDGSVKKLQVNMANIRKKFGEKIGENIYIVNELGIGYRMNGNEEYKIEE